MQPSDPHPMKMRILIVDDHKMLRGAMCHLMQEQPDMQVVGQSCDGQDIVELAQQTAAHLVCMDIGLPGMNGIELTRLLLRALPHLKVVALSAYSDKQHVLDMINAGAKGYVTKVEDGDELLRAIRAVYNGRLYLCPDVAEVVTHSLVEQIRPGRPKVALGARESQVLKLVALGYTSNQIAEQLSIAGATVDVHRRNIMRKLDRHSVAELTRYVIENEGSEPD
jgi:two-component system NarL family response regulator